jgi:hypothetical protein
LEVEVVQDFLVNWSQGLISNHMHIAQQRIELLLCERNILYQSIVMDRAGVKQRSFG